VEVLGMAVVEAFNEKEVGVPYIVEVEDFVMRGRGGRAAPVLVFFSL